MNTRNFNSSNVSECGDWARDSARSRRVLLPRHRLALAGIAVFEAALLTLPLVHSADVMVAVPPPQSLPSEDQQLGWQRAVFAGGCFWGVQGVFQHVRGVQQALSGFAGGWVPGPTYAAVTSGRTGHAESVQVTYDPRQVSYGTLLQVFFSVAHDPTQWNRQGPDVGTHYRSAIFPVNAEQAEVARAYIAQLESIQLFPRPIATQIEEGKSFFPAEAYHQDYMTRHPNQPYIRIHDLPKIDALKRAHPALYRVDPVLVEAHSGG